jgi:hypothetical protein
MQVLAEDGIGGGNMEARFRMGYEMQASTKDVVALAIPKIVQKQMQVGGDIGEAFVAYANKIEANLEKTILMIERQEDLVLPPMLEGENSNEDVEPHAQIDGGDILNLLSNLLPHPSFQMERMGGVFLSIFLLQHLC